MSVHPNSPSGDPSKASGGDGGDNGDAGGKNQDTVAYASYSKVLGEKKAAADKLKLVEEELNALKQQKLESEGNKDELIATLRSELGETKGKLEQAVKSFAGAQFKSVVAEEASKMGCSSIDLLNKTAIDRMDKFEFGDDFQPNRDQVKSMLDELKNEYPILFSKKAPNVHDGTPRVNTDKTKTDISKLSSDEIMRMLGE